MIRYLINTSIQRIEQKTATVCTERDGATIEQDLGWFVLFEGSHEMIYVGHDKPDDLVIGKATIIIEQK